MNSKMLEEIILSSSQFNEFEGEVKRGSLAKTVLIISKDREQSFVFAKLLASLILDGSFKREENYLKVMASSHPDVKVYPLKERLLVSDSEDIVFESSVKPIFAARKVFIINNIEEGMEAAQNKLLKTLEEPEANVYFIVTTQNSELVLPTIRSRCLKYELSRLRDEDLRRVIGEEDNAELIVALSEGYIGKAESLKNLENLEEIFESVLKLVVELKSSKQLLIYSKALFDQKVEASFVLELLLRIYEDLLYIVSGKSELVRLKGSASRLEVAAREYSIKAIIEIRGLIDKARKELLANVASVVVIENLLLNILEVKYLCK